MKRHAKKVRFSPSPDSPLAWGEIHRCPSQSCYRGAGSGIQVSLANPVTLIHLCCVTKACSASVSYSYYTVHKGSQHHDSVLFSVRWCYLLIYTVLYVYFAHLLCSFIHPKVKKKKRSNDSYFEARCLLLL